MVTRPLQKAGPTKRKKIKKEEEYKRKYEDDWRGRKNKKISLEF